MAHMLLLSSAVNQYIIKIYHYEFTDKWPKQLSHHSHEGGRSIGQSKGYDQPVIQPVLSFKCSLSFILWSDSNLVVPIFKINLGEDCGTWHQIQHIIKIGNEETILDSYPHTYATYHPSLEPKVRELHTGSNSL